MDLLEMILYVCATTSCLLLSLMLLVWWRDEDAAPVRSSCPMASLVAALYAVLFSVLNWLAPDGERTAVVNVAFLIVYVAHFVLTVAMKRLLQGVPMTVRRKGVLLIPVLAVWAVGCLAQIVGSSAVSVALSKALPFVCLLGMGCMAVSLGDDLQNLGKEEGLGDALRKFNRLVFASYILIGVVSWTMALLSGMAFHVAAMLLTSLSIALSILFYNRQGVYLPQFAANEEIPEPEVPQEEEPAQPQDTPLSQKLMQWERADDRPYLTRGLTLKIVAGQLEVSPRLLSEFINNQLHVNFNTYVNQLRVRFVEQELKEHPETKLQDVALRAGFTDSSAMLKVMKKMSGNA